MSVWAAAAAAAADVAAAASASASVVAVAAAVAVVAAAAVAVAAAAYFEAVEKSCQDTVLATAAFLQCVSLFLATGCRAWATAQTAPDATEQYGLLLVATAQRATLPASRRSLPAAPVGEPCLHQEDSSEGPRSAVAVAVAESCEKTCLPEQQRWGV